MCVQIWTCKYVCTFERTEQMMRSDDWMRRAEPDGTLMCLALIRTWRVLFSGASALSTSVARSTSEAHQIAHANAISFAAANTLLPCMRSHANFSSPSLSIFLLLLSCFKAKENHHIGVIAWTKSKLWQLYLNHRLVSTKSSPAGVNSSPTLSVNCCLTK